MKNFFKSLAICALAALTFASCQKENADGNMDDQSSVVSINLTSPLMGTKAFADGNTVNTVHVHVYKVDASGNLSYIAPTTGSPTKEVTMTGGSATYSARLVTGQKYTFVFWADYQADGYTSPYTYDAVNQKISVNYNAACNDEKRDAFYAVIPNVTITGAYSQSVTLKRPFAQVNFGVTAEDMAAANAAGITVNGAAVKCTHVANQLNLLDGTVSGSEDVAFASTALVSTALPLEALIVAGTTYTYVAMNYVLVGKDTKTLSDITLTLDATGAASGTPEYTYTNIPLQGNYRTNIVGELFTSPANINITVDKNFTQPDNNEIVTNVGSLAAANTALANGATNIQISNVTSSEAGTTKLQMPATPESITVTIDEIDSGANLQIEKPASGSNPTSVAVNLPPTASVSQLTINLPDSHVEVNGAAYSSITATTSNNTLVIGEDAQVTNLIIEAGAVEIYGKVGSLTNNGSGDIKVWAVGDKATFNQAYNAGAKTIALKNNIEDFTSVILIGRDLTIDGNEFEIWNTANRVIRVTESSASTLNITFKNLGIISKCTASSDVRGISFDDNCPPSSVVFDACKVSASFYAINLIAGSQGHNITIKNATVAAGWAAINCYANNSTFNIENSTLQGLNDKDQSSWNNFATIVFDGYGLNNAANIGVNGTGNTLNVVNSTIYACSESSNRQAWLAIQYGAQSNIIKVDGLSKMIDNNLGDQRYNITLLPYVNQASWTLYDIDSEIWFDSQNVFPGMYEQGGVYHIINPEGLVYLAEKVNLFNNRLSGKTVVLDNDLDMSGIEFTPIGKTVANYPGYSFAGIFDGQNHTISNLKASSNDPNYAAAGLFGTLLGTVKNVNLKDIEITSTHYAGGVAGYLGSNTGAKVLNCTVDGGTITSTPELIGESYDNGDKVGGIAGFIVYGETIDGCSVSNVTLKGYRDIGGILGCAANNSGVTTVTNCKVGENVKLIVDKEHNYKNYNNLSEHKANDIIGRTTGTATLNTEGSTGSVTIEY